MDEELNFKVNKDCVYSEKIENHDGMEYKLNDFFFYVNGRSENENQALAALVMILLNEHFKKHPRKEPEDG